MLAREGTHSSVKGCQVAGGGLTFNWLGRPLGSRDRSAVLRTGDRGVAGAAIGAISKATEGTGITKDQLETIRTVGTAEN
jgi:hypothetical protein